MRSLREADCGSVLIRIDQILSALDYSYSKGILENKYMNGLIHDFYNFCKEKGKDKGLLGHQSSFAKYLADVNKVESIVSLIVNPINSCHDSYVIEGGLLTNDFFCIKVKEVLEEKGCVVWMLS